MMTIFKKIINKEIPANIVHEDDLCLAFYDVTPQAPTHILVIPRKEIRSMAEVTVEDKTLLGHMLLVTTELAKKVGISEEGYRVVINTNQNGGQSVFHLHMHILGGRPLSWPPG
ncbi:MAG: histidine triad nucleotide-binding protein [Bdellovibrionaceae bacterium]|nr:histidine triad nucleotide-binding protein [Pseudobdellovibrionaceae bacterium]